MKQFLIKIAITIRQKPRYDWIFVGILLATYVGLALWHITAGSIWFDEAFSAYIINFNFFEIARYTAADVHPPLYYWLLQPWAALVGHTELGLRSLSIVFGVIASVFAYLWMRLQFGRRVALTALAILVLSPLFIRYSQEARMYTLAAAIVFAATYVLSRALKDNRRWQWITYGLLVFAGMLTHYFTALIWIAHWIWRLVTLRQNGVRGKKLIGAFFSRSWILAYGLAVGLYLIWLPFMVIQLVLIQSEGFWITPVGVDTVGSYFGTLVYFLQSYQITGWFAAGLIFMGIVTVVLALRTYVSLQESERRGYLLLFIMAAVPPILLFLVSLPPATSSFVERYLLPTAVASALFMGLILTKGLQRSVLWKKLLIAGVVLAMLISGLSTMYFYGNYNKNSRTGIETRAVIEQVREKSAAGVPIVTNTPWVFYEAAFYNSKDHPVYFLDESTKYEFGSLDMLKDSDQYKIKDLDAFAKQHPVIWYIGYSEGELTSPRSAWKILDAVSVTNHVDGKTVYKGVELSTQ